MNFDIDNYCVVFEEAMEIGSLWRQDMLICNS